VAQRTGGLTRGDRRRNEKVEGLRAVVRADRAILGIDLGEDKQVAALLDHDGRVLGRRVVRVKAHALDGVLGWAGELAGKRGFAGVVVGCEPTGHRWRSVMELADQAGMGFVGVQPLRVHLAREADDYTRDKTDHKDAVLIGKLVARLDCYLPERADAQWAQLRHLGQRRARLVTEVVACGQQISDLLSCCWPAALECAAKPLDSMTWLSCLAVTMDRCDGDPGKLRKLGREGFQTAVRRELPRFGTIRIYGPIAERFFTALGDQRGVTAQRRGGLQRVGLLIEDWRSALARLDQVEARMIAVLDELGLTKLVSSIPGVSTIGVAVILAETGDLTRFATARSVVKHAGLNPTEHTSATIRGRSRISHRGRPGLRTAAWRAAWGAQRSNPALRAKYIHLTTREHSRLAPGQARAACAAALLRWLYAIITTRTPYNPTLATHTQVTQATAA
jgi:transposase